MRKKKNILTANINKVLTKYFRSSQRRCFLKKDVLRKLANFIGKQLRWSPFLIKLQASDLLHQKETPTQMFPLKFAKF